MHLLEKIYYSRKTLRELLDNEWTVDTIQDSIFKRIRDNVYQSKNDSYIDSGCNLTLNNKFIPSHKLHIIYYNFPELHRTGTKINKTCCDKLTALYKKKRS